MRRITRRLFGRFLQPWEYAGLAGAPDRARVELGACHDQLYVETGDPFGNGFRMFHLIMRAGTDLVINNDGFHIQVGRMQRKGLGLRVFHRQIENAKVLGIRRIKVIAGRRAGENGYYTWPRFGFDAPLPTQSRHELPPRLAHVQTVLDLMESERGRSWWRERGVTIGVTFDVTDGSRSRRVFERYVRNRLHREQGREDRARGALLPHVRWQHPEVSLPFDHGVSPRTVLGVAKKLT